MFILLTSCVYSFRGFTPTQTYDLYIENFKNTSDRAGVELDFTRGVVEQFDQDARFRIVSENKANYSLKANISGYRVEPYQFSADGTVLSYRVSVVVILTVEDLKNKTELVKDKVVSAWGVYLSSEREEEGIKNAAEDLGRKLIQEFFSVVSK